MGEPDKTQKMLLGYNDEFAEVFSVFALKNKIQIEPEFLENSSTEYEHFETSRVGELRCDVVKHYKNAELGIIAIFGIENQMTVDYKMPVRVMGYDWTKYREQLEKTSELTRGTRIQPVISLVINFSYQQKWDWPVSLKDLLDIPPALEEFVQDYKIVVVNLAWLSDEERAELKGDIRILADALSEMRLKGHFSGSERRVKHVQALLAAVAAITHDSSYTYMDTVNFKDGETTMNNLYEQWKASIRQEAFSDGEKSGFSSGEKTKSCQVARKLLSMNQFNYETISEITGLSLHELQLLEQKN